MIDAENFDCHGFFVLISHEGFTQLQGRFHLPWRSRKYISHGGTIEGGLDMYRKLFTLILFVGLVAGLAARANADDRMFFVYRYRPAPVVIYQPAPAIVSYDPDERFSATYDLQGVVTWSVPYHMNVRIHDNIYAVRLHDGTIIKPTGITLTPSMVVNVAGYWSGGTFIANRIVVVRY
ncbi:MAG TPA: hypothetical protein VGW96_05310 [Candidatus Eremiobacteraceae bacterium]|nr:hypothetical protein [Candidatus Eremiobacteraceae bacterium]